MTREFQIVYAAAPGDLRTVNLMAAHEAAVLKIAEGIGIAVKAVTELRVVVDPNQSYFRAEEAAEYLRVSVSSFYELMTDGILPKAVEGKPIYSRRQLDAVATRHMKKMDPEILKEAA